MDDITCKNCKNRHLGCQNVDTCETYRKMREKIETTKANRNEYLKRTYRFYRFYNDENN